MIHLNSLLRFPIYQAVIIIGTLILSACSGSSGGTGNNAPVFTSGAAMSVDENSTATGYTATATDADGNTVTFSLTGGADQAAFSIDANSGVLSFQAAPDFEIPSDADTNNTYIVEITATDGTAPIALTVTVTVTNSNDNTPVFTSGTAMSAAENSTATGYTATATDADGNAVTFSLTGGVDQAAFSIDTNSGVLSFQAAPDFENPSDADTNNTYIVEITATDGTNPIAQTVTVTVTDILEITVSTAGIKTIRFDWSAYTGATFYRLLVNPDGASGFSLLQDNIPVASTSTTVVLPVHLTDWLNASYILEAHDGTGRLADSAAVNITSLMLSSIGYVKASTAETIDVLGFAVALSADGTTLAVGAIGEDSNAMGIDGNQADNNATNAGAVYIYRLSAGVWSQQAYIKASNTQIGDQFGYSVALSSDGNTLAVGAWYEDSNATGIGGNQADDPAADNNTGAVYVYRFSGTWSQQAYIKASNTQAGDNFGISVVLSADGNTLAVGASAEDSNATGIDGNQADNSATDAGAVYVYRFSGTWSQQAYIKASNTQDSDFFGVSLTLSADGNTLAVGASAEDSNATGIGGNQADDPSAVNNTGAVYVYRFSTSWSQQAYVKASNTGIADRFGVSVALSADGNTLAVGAWLEDSTATGIGGNQADNNATDAGAVYVYRFNMGMGTWSQQAYIKASNTQAGDNFGISVALSTDGNTLVVGAWDEDSNATGIGGNEADDSATDAGAVYVYRFSGTWSQQAYIKASNTDNNTVSQDQFGNSVALSSDGNTLAVGAWQEDSNATGLGGNQTDNSVANAGAVYLY